MNIKIPKAIKQTELLLNIKLADSQKIAIEVAHNNKVTIITGSPGTGKTTLVNSILQIISKKKVSIQLCAPTGRAAKRLNESTGLEALTIHRLLEGFKRNEENPLSCDYLVVDEVSMIDVRLFYSLLKAIRRSTVLLLVGDIDQLPSIGAGQVFKDIIDSKIIPVVRLTEIFRQAKKSDIIINSNLINQGLLPKLDNQNQDSDFYFIEEEEVANITDKIIKLIMERIPKKFNIPPFDIQILCPMQRGGAGVRSLNIELQKVLNPNYQNGIRKYGQIFAVGDKIMQMQNNYVKEIYNGDMGIIINIDHIEQELLIEFDNKRIIFDYNDLDQITLSYAITIHKSQGSEYPAIIIPITMQSYMMLKRNLIYTAVTRGKKLVVLIGQKKALAIAVKNKHNAIRYTKLKEWLTSLN